MPGFYVDFLVYLQQLPPNTFWIFFVVLLLTLLFSLWKFISNFRNRRLMQDTPTSKIGSASQGYVEICGRAKALDGALKSPGKSRPCVWYRFTVVDTSDNNSQYDRDQTPWHFLETLFSNIKSGNRWDQGTTETDESVYSFYVDDGSGQCTVDPTQATLHPRNKEKWKSGYYHYTEERIHEGEEIYCLGEFKTVQGISRSKAIKETARVIVNQWKSDPQQMKKFDSNKDGEIDMEEWNLAREKAKELATREVGEDYQRTEHHELVKPFGRGQPYIISAYSEEDLARRSLYATAIYATLFVTCSTVIASMMFALTTAGA